MVAMTAPGSRRSPSAATRETFPEVGALTADSIFMASMVAMAWPSSTVSPSATVSLPTAAPAAGGTSPASAGTVTLGPGKARLVVFFATWLSETSDLNSELTSLNAYTKAAAGKHLPELTAVDVVRHRLVGAIVDAYGRWDEKQPRGPRR